MTKPITKDNKSIIGIRSLADRSKKEQYDEIPLWQFVDTAWLKPKLNYLLPL